MDLTISGRHMDITDAMEDHIRARVDKLPRLDDHVLSITVTLDDTAAGDEVEVIAKCHQKVLVTSSSGHDLYASIDEAFSKMERRIRKLHEKLVEKRNREAQKAAERERTP
ncbi:MAG: ribosome hibernation-promoting factor, HPF/YfiA family [Planctomycetota bacterium]